jgi:spermidine synthase
MYLKDLKIKIHQGDAYEFLAANNEQYDAVIDDVYGSGAEDVMRPTAYTKTMGAALRRNLAPGGVFVANLVTGPGHRKMQGAFRRFFVEHFPVVRSVAAPLVGGDGLCPPSTLLPYKHLWPHAKDRQLWSQLKCRKINA